ncbi:MAG: hypothetical protein ABIN67_24405 [Ferruginibacter sp.]
MKSLVLIILCIVAGNVAMAQNVVAAEYFLDIDAGVGKNSLVSLTNPQPNGTYNLNVNLAGAAIGYHKLYIRTRDSNGNWSITTRKNIEIISSNSQSNMVAGEYFFDADPGFSLASSISVSTQGAIILQNFNATIAGLSLGYHKLYTRFRDTDGKWSITARRNVEVINPNVYVIAGAEYFFNTDPGVGLASKIAFLTPKPGGTFSFKIPITAIPPGSHTLYLRAKDSVNSNWSITQQKSDSIVTTVHSGLWSQPATWSNNKVPDANTIVLLYHDVEVDIINAVCRSLTPYGINVSCTVDPGKALTITGH